MSATFILTTEDSGLAAEWARQLPSQPLSPLAHGSSVRLGSLQRPEARVWIKDTSAIATLTAGTRPIPTPWSYL